MPNDIREIRTEQPAMLLAWGLSQESRDPLLEAGLWLTAGASVLLWTALVLLLTAA